jgi:hypothetical protein
VIVRQDFLEDVLVGQVIQQIQSQFHRSYPSIILIGPQLNWIASRNRYSSSNLSSKTLWTQSLNLAKVNFEFSHET